MEEVNLNSWEEFQSQLNKLRESAKSKLLFRGQQDSCWPLSTTLDRKQERMLFTDYYRIVAKIRPHIEALTAQNWLIPEYPSVEKSARDYDSFSLQLWSGRCPGYAYMAYLRHHGFPSPLLDWTRSPYVAAFFAFHRVNGNSNSRVAIYAFSEISNKISGNHMPVVYPYGSYVKSHRRHVLQQSEYTLCLAYEAEWRFENYETVFKPGSGQQGRCWKFTLPVAERSKVLRSLDEHNLNAFSLFGSEDSLMEMLAVREFVLELGS